ncbi:cyclopropane-fatty-acyl-phospholipid synthase [Psychromarinibacter sp. C21-152]|uniref:Cyclopropane-fatty-acyl-phospholipid synthase n=1 Tax=Psychromarinibacter sediminicola TaxID=3033385 RepID=A0AAE3TAS7_9RHOB|nr:cyclopropane-fatty-acyl-phospholipid synthase family protein [Psychromarinibacter sediminicola]MDF0601930.1 cyclopropane-fatty-acyl-phospholipid synthase [Psychromarinibacter sediminicola]
MAFVAMLGSIVRDGSLCVIDASGEAHHIGDGSAPKATLRLTSKLSEYTMVVNPALSVGEAYMDGRLVIEDGSLYDFLDVVARNFGPGGQHPWLVFLKRLRRGLKQSNPMGRAQRNVAHHYDLSPEFYDIFLDQDRQYSCAYFKSMDETLDAAQENKKRHIAAKLCLDRPGLRVLDIGSGWGGMALYLAETFGAEVTGVTLSKEQHSYSLRRAADSPASERVRFELQDYREIEGHFDRIVSVGMFEHVGKKNYPEFFARLRALLTEDGIALVHSIGYADAPGPINPFIRKYVFPGADLPSMSEVFGAAEPNGLFVTDLEILRLHYAETLRRWRERFTARSADVITQYDARFFRMWEFYLVLSEIGFRQRTNIVFQMQIARRIDAVPITRDYMTDVERNLEKADM